MPVFSYDKQAGRQISDHFHSSELNCPCDVCRVTLVDTELVLRLEKLREGLGTTLTITSGYRCHNYQNELKLRGYEVASGTSQHELGKAADVTNGVALGIELEDEARKAGFLAVGVGKNWVHVDVRLDKERRWVYVKR